MSKCLIEDYPLMVSPRLAATIGLNEAIFLQQVHYWLISTDFEADGRKWVYNTMKQWHEQFPYCSERTLARIISSLTKQGLILTANYNRRGGDQTKWYSIDYEALDRLELPEFRPKKRSGNPTSGQRSAQPKHQDASPADVRGSSNLPKWQIEKNQGAADRSMHGSTSMSKCQVDADRDASKAAQPRPADCQDDRSSLPDCQSGFCQDGKGSMPICQVAHANMAEPLPENNARETAEITEEATIADRAIPITARSSSLPLEEVKVSTAQRELLLFASKIGMSEARMVYCLEEYGVDRVRRQVKLLQKNLELKKPIKNPAGWLIKALKEDYKDSAKLYAVMCQKEKAARRAAAEVRNRRLEAKYAEMHRAEMAEQSSQQGEFYEKYILGRQKHTASGEALPQTNA